MKATISKDGYLHIYRKKSKVVQICPYQKDSYCGHQCSLFGEPTRGYTMINAVRGENTTLHLCQKTLVFDIFIDERENDEL